MMKRLVMSAILSILLIAAPVFAQTPPKVSFQKGTLSWEYTQGTALATEFRMKCGTSSGIYTKITIIPVANRSLPVSQAIPAVGTYYCAVVAANDFGESDPSNEVNFIAGNTPNTPTNLKLGTVGQ